MAVERRPRPRYDCDVRAYSCFVLALLALGGCSGSSTGKPCGSADDCYTDAERDQVSGTIECLDRTPDGYCTHTCSSDADCCATEGECEDQVVEVCAPFENSSTKRCFVSCESSRIGDSDENDYCVDHAGIDFGCRSTGGGAQNRKVCFPN